MHPRNIALLLALGTAVLLAPGVGAQKGKPPGNQPVTVKFDYRPGDRLLDDGNTTPYNGIINSVGEFVLNVDPGSQRWVRLDFAGSREQTGTCNPCAFLPYENDELMLGDDEHFGMATNVVDGAGNPVDGGIEAIPIGAEAQARFNPTFADPAGRDLYFVLRYYPVVFWDSAYVWITRTSLNAWEIQTHPDDGDPDNGFEDTARLWRHTSSRKSFPGPADEGLFHMPFKIKVTRP